MTRRSLFRTMYIWVGGLFLPTRKAGDLVKFDEVTLGVDDGRIVRCYGEPRNNQKGHMFECNKKGSLIPNLEGYAIIPIEKWEKLTGKKLC